MIAIANKIFSGPLTSTDDIQHQSGVFAILTINNFGRYEIIDIGGSSDIKTTIDLYYRSRYWDEYRKKGLFYAVYYSELDEWSGMESTLRNMYANFVV